MRLISFLSFFIILATSALTQPAQETQPTPTAQQANEEAMALLQGEDLPLVTRIEAVTNILKRYPDEADIWAALGELRLQAQDNEGALKAFERAVEKNPALHSSWHWIGIIKKRLKTDLEGAVIAFENAIQHGAPKAVQMNEIAVTLAQMGRMEDALAKWEEAIDLDPEWGVLYTNATKAAISLGRENTARKWFQRGLQAQRFEERGALMYGDHLVRQGERDAALEAYRMALEVQPENSRLRYYYAITLTESGEKEQAITHLQKARENANTEKDKTTASAISKALFALENPKDMKRLLRAEQLVMKPASSEKEQAENFEDAIEDLGPIIEENPELWEPRLLRGVAHRRLGNIQGARADFEGVLTTVAEQPNALINLALLFRDSHDFYHAVEYTRRAVDAAPHDPAILVNAGLIMSDTYHCDDARLYLEMARRVLPDEHENELVAPLVEELKTSCGE